jgi:hypothetical protein
LLFLPIPPASTPPAMPVWPLRASLMVATLRMAACRGSRSLLRSGLGRE